MLNLRQPEEYSDEMTLSGTQSMPQNPGGRIPLPRFIGNIGEILTYGGESEQTHSSDSDSSPGYTNAVSDPVNGSGTWEMSALESSQCKECKELVDQI